MQMALPFGVGASGTVAAGPLAVGFRAVCFEGAPQAEGTARFRTREDGRVSVYWTIWSIGAGDSQAQALLSVREIGDLSRGGHDSHHGSPDGSVIAIKKVEAALRSSEERFRRLVENAMSFRGKHARGRALQYVGPQAVALLGYPLESWLNEGFGSGGPSDDQGG